MKQAIIRVHDNVAGVLQEVRPGEEYRFCYAPEYNGPPVSLTMPVAGKIFHFSKFPPFFDGLLPEGPQLEGLLKGRKIDADDLFEQLLAVGADLVGAVTVERGHHG
jgi:serine/threonine-protein kinase HipA